MLDYLGRQESHQAIFRGRECESIPVHSMRWYIFRILQIVLCRKKNTTNGHRMRLSMGVDFVKLVYSIIPRRRFEKSLGSLMKRNSVLPFAQDFCLNGHGKFLSEIVWAN